MQLSPEIQQLVQQKIASGRYASADDVVADALRHLDEHAAWQELRAFLQPRIESAQRGELIAVENFDSIIEEIKKPS